MPSFNEILGITELGLVFSLVAIAIFLSFRVLKFSDLTVDASFTLGSAVFAVCLNNGWGLYSSLLLALLSGACAGLATATLAITLGFRDLLGSILVMYALYSVNFRIVERSNLALNTETYEQSFYFLLISVAFVLALLFFLLRTEVGLTLRAVGLNEDLVSQYGFPQRTLKFLGLGISNACVALSGALFTFVSGFYDINIGTGTLIAGLASLVIGESLSNRISFALLFCVVGSILYRLAIHMGFHSAKIGLMATDLNVITASIIIAFVLLRKFTKSKGVKHAFV